MAVVSVTQRVHSSMGTNALDTARITSRAVREFDVVVSDPVNDDDATVLVHPSIPIVRSAHPSRQWLRCKDIDVDRLAPLLYRVTASYEAQINAVNNPDASPLDQPPDIEWGTIASEEPIDEDVDGKPICTVLGEPFDPRLTIVKRDLQLRYSVNVSDFDPSLIVTYADNGGAVNSDIVLGQPPGTVRVNGISARAVFDEDFSYYRVTIECQFRRGAPRTTDEKAFWRRVIAQGFYASTLGPDGNLRIYRVHKHGQPSTIPVLHHKEDGQPFADVDPNSPVWPEADWYEFEVHPSLPFSALGLF